MFKALLYALYVGLAAAIYPYPWVCKCCSTSSSSSSHSSSGVLSSSQSVSSHSSYSRTSSGLGGDCGFCDPVTAHSRYAVTLPTGFTNGLNCPNCTALNGGTFILNETSGSLCNWVIDVTYTLCSPVIAQQITINLQISQSGSDILVQVLLLLSDGFNTQQVNWKKTFTSVSTINCDFDGLEIPFDFKVGSQPYCGIPATPGSVFVTGV